MRGMCAFARFGRLVAALVVLAGVCNVEAAPTYQIIDLGTLGGLHTRAYDINDAGFVVGTSAASISPGALGHSYIWDPATQTMTSQSLQMGGSTGAAYAINNNNDIALTIDGTGFAYLGYYQNLGSLGGGGTVPYDINDNGDVVGTTLNGVTQERAFKVSTSAGMPIQPTDDLTPTGGTESRAFGVNSSGHVVGCQDGGTGFPGGGYRTFGSQIDPATDTICPPGADTADVRGINDSDVCVGVSLTAGPGGTVIERAFVFDGSMYTHIGPAGSDSSRAFAINNGGKVVGDSDLGPFYYDGVTTLLTDMLTSVPTGWELQHASAINKHGLIVGNYDLYGRVKGFLMTPLGFIASTGNQTSTSGGGTAQIGGSSVTLDVTSPGTLTVEYSNDPAGLPAATFGAFGSNPVQYWDIEFTGEFSGSATVTLCYDPTTLTCPENLLVIQHWDQALSAWVPLTKISQDLVNHTITVVTPSFSPFVIGAPEPATMGLLVAGAVVLLTRRSKLPRRGERTRRS